MINCNSCKENVSNFLDDKLARNQKSEFQQHLSKCPKCDQMVARVRKLCSSLHLLVKVKTSPEFEAVLHARIRREVRKDRFFNFAWLFNNGQLQLRAAGLVGVLAIFLLIVFVQMNKYQQNDITPVAVKQPQLIHYVLDEIPHSRLIYQHTIQTDTLKNVIVQNANIQARAINYSSVIAF